MRGPKPKIDKSDVLKILQDNEDRIITIGEIANQLKVSIPTISKKVKELREDGYIILPFVNGLKFTESVDTEQDARSIVFSVHRLSGFMSYISDLGDITLPYISQALSLLDLDEKQLDKLQMKLHKLSYVCNGLSIDKQLKRGSQKEIDFK